MTNPTSVLHESRTIAKVTITDPIIEAAKDALPKVNPDINTTLARYEAEQVVAAVTHLIRAEALEEAAKVAEERERRERDNDGEVAYIEACRDIAYSIRALKEQP